MGLKNKLYDFVVRKNENVQYEYERYVQEHLAEHYENRGKHWKILRKLIWHYRIKKNTDPMIYWDRNKFLCVQDSIPNQDAEKISSQEQASVAKKVNSNVKMQQPLDLSKLPKGPYCDGAESTVIRRPAPYHFVLGLLQYDVISFDIFDTLLFRPFQNPTDLFNIVGKRLKYPAIFTGYKKGRMDSELEARTQLEKDYGTREINIYEIYAQLEKKLGVPADVGIQTEIETEKDYLFANPYMQIVYNILRAQGKTIILTSDMYIPGKIMEVLVNKCGYEGYDKLYVSCDYRCNKTSGELYRRIINDYPDKKIVHIGDNPIADIQGAKKAGLETWYYKNVNEVGSQFRGEWMSNLTGSAYNGLINAYLHNGLNQYPFFYEYGFVYGGIYIFGFCHWLEEKAKKEGIDKIIFLARDGDIYQKVYNKFYGDISNEYIFWSRFANMKYMIELQQDAFVDRVIKQKALGTLDVELSSILASFSIDIPEDELKKYGLYNNSIVNRYNMEAVKVCIRNNWNQICEGYREERNRVIKEVKTLIGDAKRIAVIDVGWTGSGPLGFKAFIEEYITKDCEIKCWMAGGAGSYGSGEFVLPYYMDGTVDAYLFSPLHNKRNEQIHISENIAVTNNAVFELFTQTQYPSFRGIGKMGNLEFDIPETENFEVISQIHKGIMDFCALYRRVFCHDQYMYNISGHDAYRPFANLAFHKSYFEKNFRNIINGYGLSGDQKHQCIETIGERMEHYYAHNGGRK